MTRKRGPRMAKTITFQPTPEIFAFLKAVESGRRSALINSALTIGVNASDGKRLNMQTLRKLRAEIAKASREAGMSESQLLAAMEVSDIVSGLPLKFGDVSSEPPKGE